MTEQELYDLLWERLCTSKDVHYAAAAKGDYSKPIYQPEAYAELAKDLGMELWRYRERMKAGITVRIVMVSRLGDLGVTDQLGDQYGYIWRVQPGDGYLINCRLTKERT
jgi:hypothetical protein